MPATRYDQFCALARAAELLGERWTLLIVRELLLGPKRFTDLIDGLPGISRSVLTERLAGLEEDGLIEQTFLEPPAASTVYQLTEHGAALQPAVFELVRWGARFLYPRRPGEPFDPELVRLAMAAYAKTTRTPARSFELRMPHERKEVVIHVAGGSKGTVVSKGGPPGDVTLTADGETMLAMMAGVIDPVDAHRSGRVHVDGDMDALSAFPQLFDPRTEQPKSRTERGGQPIE